MEEVVAGQTDASSALGLKTWACLGWHHMPKTSEDDSCPETWLPFLTHNIIMLKLVTTY
jgi:hypothetical protein